ncbi:hypothetical protein [Lentzea sp. NPDC059081]|uniref:hypothetical protein n=1 Tax=Lentzea sp. NPDC059081 TaxID=3346719 RepID=UPI00369839A3
MGKRRKAKKTIEEARAAEAAKAAAAKAAKRAANQRYLQEFQFGLVCTGPLIGHWGRVVESRKTQVALFIAGVRHVVDRRAVKFWRFGQPKPSLSVVIKSPGASIKPVSGGLPTLGKHRR